MKQAQVTSLSIVSPVYRAQDCIDALYQRLKSSLSTICDDYEIILVNDNSPDNSWDKIRALCSHDEKVKGVNLSRNFGQHYAISAGLSLATKDWIVVMDCDLQDQPEQIHNFISSAVKGYEVILARRAQRQDNWFKRFVSFVFYKVLSYLTGSEQDSSIANFGLYHSKVIKAILSSGESIRYFPTMIQWAGFKKIKVDVEHAQRLEGVSSYNLKRMLNLALDVILAYTDKPLRLVVKLGIAISFFSFTFVGYVIWNAFMGNYKVLGYASLLASLWLLAGIIIFIMGIVGLYVGKNFEQSKGRPPFIISDIIN